MASNGVLANAVSLLLPAHDALSDNRQDARYLA